MRCVHNQILTVGSRSCFKPYDVHRHPVVMAFVGINREDVLYADHNASEIWVFRGPSRPVPLQIEFTDEGDMMLFSFFRLSGDQIGELVIEPHAQLDRLLRLICAEFVAPERRHWAPVFRNQCLGEMNREQSLDKVFVNKRTRH